MKLIGRLLYMGLQKQFAARAAMFLYLIFSVAQTLLAMGVWVIAQQQNLKGGASANTLVTYFVLITLFIAFIWSGTANRVGSQDIRKGKLGMWLLKPVPYFLTIILDEVAWRVLRVMITIPVFIILGYIFRDYLQIDVRWFLFSLLFFPLGYLVFFLVQFITGALAFWWDYIDEFIELVEVLMILFSGAGIPLFLLPPIMEKISFLLPFRYVLFTPTYIAMGKLDSGEIVKFIFILFGWIFILIMALRIIWRRGLMRYSAEGI